MHSLMKSQNELKGKNKKKYYKSINRFPKKNFDSLQI